MKWIRGGNCCANKILSLRKEFSYRQNIIWHKSYQCFLKSVSQGNRNKNKQMEDRQTYKLLHSKRNHKGNKKTTYRMGENICKWCNRWRRNLQNIQTAHRTQQQKMQSKIRRLKQTSLQERHRWHMRRCLMLLMIREMQSEATTRYHLIPVRMTIIKKSTNSKRWRGSGEKETPTVLVETYARAVIVENSMKVPQKTKNRTSIRSSNPTPGNTSGLWTKL